MSDRLRLALAGSLAMVVAIGLAMAWGWERPYWAALGVAVCTQLSDGESVQKALMRLTGTVLGVCILFLGMALFPQDRLLTLLYIGAYTFIGAYLMTQVRRFYILYLAVLVPTVLATADKDDPVLFFDLAMTRSLETGLGVGVYCLIALVVFPTSTRKRFDTAISVHLTDLDRLLRSVLEPTVGEVKAPSTQATYRDAVARQSGLPTLLDATEFDSIAVFERKGDWRQAIAALGSILDATDRLRLERSDLDGRALGAWLPGLPAYREEIAARLAAVRTMLDGDVPNRWPGDVTLVPDATSTLSPAAAGALDIARARLGDIDEASRRLVDSVAWASGFKPNPVPPARPKQPTGTLIPDPEHLMGATRAVLGFYVPFAAYVWIDDLPMPSFILILGIVVSLQLGMIFPYLSPAVLIPALFISLLFGMVQHVFIMPRLSGYTELALMIFLSTFAILMVFTGISKGVGLALWANTTQLTGDVQSYSFTYFTSALPAIAISLFVLWLLWQMPFDFTPQRAFERNLKRFLRSARALLEDPAPGNGSTASWLQRQEHAFHRHQMVVLPTRLATCARYLPRDTIGDDNARHIDDLVGELGLLAKRLHDVTEFASPLAATGRAHAPHLELSSCRDVVTALAKSLEAQASEGPLSDRNAQSSPEPAANTRAASADQVEAYRPSGAYRGLAETLHAVATQWRLVNWPRLCQPRFYF